MSFHSRGSRDTCVYSRATATRPNPGRLNVPVSVPAPPGVFLPVPGSSHILNFEFHHVGLHYRSCSSTPPSGPH